MDFPANAELIDAGNLDELVRHTDRLADAADWPGLDDLRHRARRAFEERGRQLWPVATRAEYRLALDAPGEWAASVLVDGTGHLGPGPLAEVAASTHTWNELAAHLLPGPAAAWFAHERVARGEDLRGDPRVPPGGPDTPLALAHWEPSYPQPVYRVEGLEEPGVPQRDRSEMTPTPDRVGGSAAPRLAEANRVAEAEPARQALEDITEAWRRDSNGRARAVAVRGGHAAALAALGVPEAAIREVAASDALAAIAGAAASGGAHGRRRGLARGRFEAWWVAAHLTALDDEWPPSEEELGAALSELRWHLWTPAGALAMGWELRLVVEDPLDGLAWALEATDHYAL